MPASVNLPVPIKKDTKRAKPTGEPKSVNVTKKSAVVEVPVKKEPKKEKKVVKTTKRKVPEKPEPPKKSSRNTKKTTTISSLDHDAPSTQSKNKPISPNGDDRSIDKKKSINLPVEKPKKKAKTAPKKKPVPEKSFNMELAQAFFKQMMETQRKKNGEDPLSSMRSSNLETMPESSNVSVSKKSIKKSYKKKRSPLDRNIFKANGEPVWVVPDRKPGELVENAEGDKVRYPELSDALAEDGLVMEDGKGWYERMPKFFEGQLDEGISGEKPPIEERDPRASMAVMEKHNEDYFQKPHILYNTAESIFNLCDNAIEKFIVSNGGEQDTANRRRAIQEAKKEQPKKEEAERTAIQTTIRFNLDSLFSIRYDRRRPIASIQKFRKKYQERLKLSNEQPTQPIK